jgi:hypothetical protein
VVAPVKVIFSVNVDAPNRAAATAAALAAVRGA